MKCASLTIAENAKVWIAQKAGKHVRMTDRPRSDHFIRATMRHFAELRAAGPEAVESAQSFPKDWFDLSDAVLSDFGSMVYLSGLTRHHRQQSLANIMSTLEPPLRLGQYRIIRSDGYPRAFLTWAGLGSVQERRFSIEHKALHPEDWNSGPSVWLVDFVSPFGHIEKIVPLLTGNTELQRLRTLWHNRAGSRYRVVEWTRPAPEAKIVVRSYGVGQFARVLLGRAG